MSVTLLHGDCLEELKSIADCSIDAVVTDPPYGINFMGKAWDGKAIEEAARRERESGRPLPPRLTGDHDHPERRKLTERTGSAFANRAGEAGAYDLSLGRYGDERDWSDMGGPTGRDNRTHTQRGGAMHAGTYDLSGAGLRGFQSWCELWGRELLRVLKPGGHALVFGGTRTYHRLACGLEEAGFEIRDSLAWMFGSGFPKSLDLARAIDTKLGAQGGWRQEDHPGRPGARTRPGDIIGQSDHRNEENPDGLRHVYEPRSDEALEWDGWGTALKPGYEPIVLARKPVATTITANVLEHRTGALHIDACRIAITDPEQYARNHSGDRGHDGTRPVAERGATDLRPGGGSAAEGRWPANVILDEESAAMLDMQAGELRSGDPGIMRLGENTSTAFGAESRLPGTPMTGYGDRGGASRFFYCAKVSRAERNAGLENVEEAKNHHPTVKPIDLMRWLVRLVTPAGGVVLDPFLGSGSTGCATSIEDVSFIGIEREADYMRIAEARIAFWAEHGEDGLRIVRERDQAESRHRELREAGQTSLFDSLTDLSTSPTLPIVPEGEAE